MHDVQSAEEPLQREKWGLFVQWFVHLVIAFLCVSSGPPGVNESHYLPKAKHIWDSTYASGGDLFLQSHDSHFLTTTFAGFASRHLSLTAVAWIGRLISWILLAIAWVRLCEALKLSALLRPLAFILWFLLTRYGHWAGEWYLGGFEAKTLAYPCVLCGLACAVESRWAVAWIWLGAAVAFHPVVGGWAGITVGLSWLMSGTQTAPWKQQLPWLALGAAIGMIGVVPALGGLGGVDRVDNISAAQVHVFFRLSHHMCPQTFGLERHLAALASVGALVLATWLWKRDLAEEPTKRFRMLQIAWFAVGISAIGGLVDLTVRADIAARILRFYWFRWSDVMVPLAVAVTTTAWLQSRSFKTSGMRLRDLTELGNYYVGLALMGIGIFFGLHIYEARQSTAPEGDVFLLSAQGPYGIDTDRLVDWLAVCNWIDENTPPDSLWLTPRYQQTFKWYAGRAEVVSWKDIPQDSPAIIEWYRRILRCSPPRDNQGNIRGWTTNELIALGKLYQCGWILIDRTCQTTPPALELMYPIDLENRSFAVFRMPTDVIERSNNPVQSAD